MSAIGRVIGGVDWKKVKGGAEAQIGALVATCLWQLAKKVIDVVNQKKLNGYVKGLQNPPSVEGSSEEHEKYRQLANKALTWIKSKDELTYDRLINSFRTYLTETTPECEESFANGRYRHQYAPMPGNVVKALIQGFKGGVILGRDPSFDLSQLKQVSEEEQVRTVWEAAFRQQHGIRSSSPALDIT